MRHQILSILAVSALAGCGNPLDNIDRLSTVDRSVAVAGGQNEAGEGGGLFSRLRNRGADDQTDAAVEAALSDLGAVSDAPDDLVEVAAASDTGVEPSSPRRGLGGLFSRNNTERDVPRRGPDAADVEPRTVLPFGEIARVCGVSRSDLGTRIDGGAGFSIYDTIPSSTSRRPFYITGFADDCARTFTGAVVVTGDVQTHEFVRYQASNESIGYTTVDNAYEALKASVCRVGRGQPCGERTGRLNQNTYFITVYDFFGGTFSAVPTQWAQILVHDGEVLAMSLKDG